MTRVSLRSKGTVDVRAVAQRFGGGGHLNASGFTSTDRLDVGARHAAAAAARRPQVSAAPDGVLVVDKPEGMTSHDVVAAVRRRLPRGTKVGHTGTLDPFATGVLPVVIGKATRLSQFLTASRKRYRACVTFGTATDSGDRMGAPIETADPRRARRTRCRGGGAGAGHAGRHAPAGAPGALGQEGGWRTRVRPRASRRRRGSAGRRGHGSCPVHWWPGTTRARRPRSSSRCQRATTSGAWRATSARRLGVPAHLTALRRTRSGEWCLEDAHPLAEVMQALAGGFRVAPAADVRLAAVMARHRPGRTTGPGRPGRPAGRTPPGTGRRRALEPGTRARLLDEAGDLVALALPTAERARGPRRHRPALTTIEAAQGASPPGRVRRSLVSAGPPAEPDDGGGDPAGTGRCW